MPYENGGFWADDIDPFGMPVIQYRNAPVTNIDRTYDTYTTTPDLTIDANRINVSNLDYTAFDNTGITDKMQEELDKILLADTAYGISGAQSVGLDLLTKIGVNDYILPDLVKGIGMEQRPDYHKYDVYTHILKAVECSDPEVRLAALFHDIAKPYCKLTTGKYRGHDIEGYRMTIEIMTGLRYPTEVIYKTATLVKHQSRWECKD